MEQLISGHIQETESDRRAVKAGWYALNACGQIRGNRFANREDCQANIRQQQIDFDPHPLSPRSPTIP
jgi:hypothetical protein